MVSRRVSVGDLTDTPSARATNRGDRTDGTRPIEAGEDGARAESERKVEDTSPSRLRRLAALNRGKLPNSGRVGPVAGIARLPQLEPQLASWIRSRGTHGGELAWQHAPKLVRDRRPRRRPPPSRGRLCAGRRTTASHDGALAGPPKPPYFFEGERFQLRQVMSADPKTCEGIHGNVRLYLAVECARCRALQGARSSREGDGPLQTHSCCGVCDRTGLCGASGSVGPGGQARRAGGRRRGGARCVRRPRSGRGRRRLIEEEREGKQRLYRGLAEPQYWALQGMRLSQLRDD